MPATHKQFNKVGFSFEQADAVRRLKDAVAPTPTVDQLVTAGFTARQAKVLRSLETTLTTVSVATPPNNFTPAQMPAVKRLRREAHFSRDQVALLLVA